MRVRSEAVVNELSKRAASNTLVDVLRSVEAEALRGMMQSQEGTGGAHSGIALHGDSSAETQFVSSSLTGYSRRYLEDYQYLISKLDRIFSMVCYLGQLQ